MLLTIVALLLLLAWRFAAGASEITPVADARRAQVISLTPPVPGGQLSASTWIYVDDWNYRFGEPKTILRLGGTNMNEPFCLELRMAPARNDLEVSIPMMGNTHTEPFKCTVSDLPLQRWTLITTGLQGRTLDIYIDGKLARTCALPMIPATNKCNTMHVTPNGGFAGWTAKAVIGTIISPQSAFNMYKTGPGNNFIGGHIEDWKLQIALVNKDLPGNGQKILWG